MCTRDYSFYLCTTYGIALKRQNFEAGQLLQTLMNDKRVLEKLLVYREFFADHFSNLPLYNMRNDIPINVSDYYIV